MPPLFGGFARATDEAQDGGLGQTLGSDQLEAAAIEYVNRYIETAYLYNEADFVENTLLAVAGESTISTTLTEEPSIALNGVSYTVDDLQGNLQQFGDVAEFFGTTRQANGIERYNFNVDFSVIETDMDETTAYVKLYTLISFQYELDGETAVLGDNWEVQFAKVGGTWRIANVIAEEIEACGLTKEEFDCAAATEAFFAAQEVTTTQSTTAQLVSSPAISSNELNATGTVINNRYYNRNNAAAYAYTYTTQAHNEIDNPLDDQSFLNPNFVYYGNSGGNCQNFVSQCVWAGFYGNDSSEYIGPDAFPMDAVGSSDSYKWFFTYGGGVYSTRPSWTGVGVFYSYIQASNNSSSTTGISSSVYSIPANGSFASVTTTTSALIGGVLHVSGNTHAIIITGATGTSFSDVTYCANSPMRKAVVLGDNTAYCGSAMRLILPQYFRIANACDGHTYPSFGTSVSPSGRGSVCNQCGYESLTVHSNAIKPIAAGTTKTIGVEASMTCYKIKIGVTTPSGTTTWATYTNVGAPGRSYTFNSTGLYTITIKAYDIDDSRADCYEATYIYKVRVY